MLVAAVIPHHHHPNGMICMKQDLPVEQQCPTHHHHPGNDSCCSSECMTRFYSPTPSIHTDSGPDYVFIATLFTDVIIEHLLRPQEKRIKNYYVYRDSLHGTDTHRTTSLRAPPYSVFAYSGRQFTMVDTAEAGMVCALKGLNGFEAGQGLGFEKDMSKPLLNAYMNYELPSRQRHCLS